MNGRSCLPIEGVAGAGGIAPYDGYDPGSGTVVIEGWLALPVLNGTYRKVRPGTPVTVSKVRGALWLCDGRGAMASVTIPA